MNNSRIVVRVLTLLGIMLGLLWLFGGRTISWSRSFETQAAPDRIFSCLIDPELRLQWMEGVVAIEPITNFGAAIGAKHRITLKQEKHEVVMEDEILDYHQDQLLRLEIESPSVVITSIFTIEPFGEQTRLGQQMRVRYRGMARFFAPFLGGELQQQLDRDQKSLRELLAKE
ncbi:MAG: SRPBCC family protein [Pirellulaceae bacterium]|nr:SRPBCC family protein [Pirellulaceae bacterium]